MSAQAAELVPIRGLRSGSFVFELGEDRMGYATLHRAEAAAIALTGRGVFPQWQPTLGTVFVIEGELDSALLAAIEAFQAGELQVPADALGSALQELERVSAQVQPTGLRRFILERDSRGQLDSVLALDLNHDGRKWKQ